jgi:hypothetical protein
MHVLSTDFGHWVEIAKNVCEILAILGGATWTYLNYFRGRVYKPRLECSIEASVEKHSGHSFLHVLVKIRNIGLSKVPIEQKGTGLLIFSVSVQGPSPSFPIPVPWNEPVAAFDVFSGRKWVESSESIAEALMLTLPHGDAFAYKATLKVVSGELWWTAESVVRDT